MTDNVQYFECQCGHPDHVLRFSILDDPEEPGIYAHVLLNHYYPWYQRMWVAIRYATGYKSRTGHFDEWWMRDKDVIKLRDMCSDFLDKSERVSAK